MQFTDKEWLRYTRHVQLPQIGAAGQTILKQSHVLIVGAGGLGSPVSLYLAAAGVGTITIVDNDVIELSNLQRQILFTTDQIGQTKVECAKQRLLALNPDIQVNAIEENVNINNIDALIKNTDLVLDCTDNFATRYLINDTCLKLAKPWIFASIFQFSGQCSLFTPDTACFRCLFPDYPDDIEDCNTAGVMGVLPGLLGTIQANETIKYLTKLTCPLTNHLMLVDTMDLHFKLIKLAKNTDCFCANKLNDKSSFKQEKTCDIALQKNEISPLEFNKMSNNKDCIVVDIRTHAERNAFHIGGQHIPLDQLESEITTLDKNKLILSYCQSGKRCIKSYALLNKHGFRNKILQGGLVNLLKQTN